MSKINPAKLLTFSFPNFYLATLIFAKRTCSISKVEKYFNRFLKIPPSDESADLFLFPYSFPQNLLFRYRSGN